MSQRDSPPAVNSITSSLSLTAKLLRTGLLSMPIPDSNQVTSTDGESGLESSQLNFDSAEEFPNNSLKNLLPLKLGGSGKHNNNNNNMTRLVEKKKSKESLPPIDEETQLKLRQLLLTNNGDLFFDSTAARDASSTEGTRL